MFYRASACASMHAAIMIWNFVRPSRCGIVYKRMHVLSNFFSTWWGHNCVFFVSNRRYKILTLRPSTVGVKHME